MSAALVHTTFDHLDSDNPNRLAGIFFVLPCIENYTKVDLRTSVIDIPPQEVSAILPIAKQQAGLSGLAATSSAPHWQLLCSRHGGRGVISGKRWTAALQLVATNTATNC